MKKKTRSNDLRQSAPKSIFSSQISKKPVGGGCTRTTNGVWGVGFFGRKVPNLSSPRANYDQKKTERKRGSYIEK